MAFFVKYESIIRSTVISFIHYFVEYHRQFLNRRSNVMFFFVEIFVSQFRHTLTFKSILHLYQQINGL